jgi:hypothetical protein
MAFGAAFAQSLALLLTEATAIANVADNAASSPITNLFIALHTASATAGNQTTSEATYTSYARVTVARSSSGWTSASGVFTNDAAITFPACTGGSNTISHVSIGTLTSGAGVVIVGGALTANLSVSSGITPQFAISALSTTIA